MVEGTFPKVDGDILYGSEANRLASVSRGLFIGSMIAAGSATGIQETGSIVIGAGSLTNPAFIEINHMLERNQNVSMFGIGISGMSTNATLYLGSGGGDNMYANTRIICGSPYKGIMTSTEHFGGTHGQKLVSTGRIEAGATIQNLDTGSTVVLFFNQSGATGNVQFVLLHVQTYGNV